MGFLDSIVNKVKGSVESNVKGSVNREVNKSVNQAVKNVENAITNAATTSTKKFTFDAIPSTIDEFKALKGADLKDPFAVIALTILAFNAYVENKDAGTEMLNFLKGPETLSPTDFQFIRDRFMDGKSYVVKSYFKGAKPDNDYTPSQPLTIEVQEQAHSKDAFKEGYIKLWVTSGGADSARYINLRTKPSTGEWFLWDYKGILLDIRKPVSQDKWA